MFKILVESESSQTVILGTALVKEDERLGQGQTYASLLKGIHISRPVEC
jgi:hypothetical protein